MLETQRELLASLWSKAGASNPDTKSPWTYKRPTVISNSNGRFAALLVGIDRYESDALEPLQGAVADVKAFREYFEVDLGIAKGDIRSLVNSEATRIGIIDALAVLKNDATLERGDPIFVFFAGYGGEQGRPSDLDSVRVVERCILPYDYAPGSHGEQVAPIQLELLNSLVSQIVEEKGDNVTLILDCSFAPYEEEVRESSFMRARSARIQHLVPSIEHNTQSNASDVDYDALPYMLFTACSPSEVAWETYGRGNFSKAILHLLRRSSPHELVYEGLLPRIDQIPRQTPQCLGRNKSRNMFDSKIAVTQRTSFQLTNVEGECTLHAGAIHGIAAGAEFTVYANGDHSFERPVGVMSIKSLRAFSATLVPDSNSNTSDFPESGIALQTKVGKIEDVRFYIPPEKRFLPCYQALINIMGRNDDELENIHVVDSPRDAHLEIGEEGGRAVFLMHDERITQYGVRRLWESVDMHVEEIIPVLKAAARYFWKIQRTNVDPLISTKVKVEYYSLEDSEEGDLVAVGPSLYHDNMVEFVVEEDRPYGINLVNEGPYDLYPYIFYFDNSDLSIGTFYEPPMGTEDSAALKKNGGSLSIGYGAEGSLPFSFFLRINQNLDLGFLKIFLSTKPVDLSSMPQMTPFETTRSLAVDKFTKETADSWSTILIPVLQHRFASGNSP